LRFSPVCAHLRTVDQISHIKGVTVKFFLQCAISLLALTSAPCDNSRMALREEIQKKIDRKRSEIDALETQARDARIYVQALEDTLKMLPRDPGDDETLVSSSALRAGSKADKARAAIQAAGKPLHVIDLLKILGIANKPKERQALAGSLSSYARKREIFTRPMPNTFGLIGLETRTPSPPAGGPPPNFGKDQPRGVAEGDELVDDFEEGTPIDVDEGVGDYGMDEEGADEIVGVVVPVAKGDPRK
jgi:hypothetical protein